MSSFPELLRPAIKSSNSMSYSLKILYAVKTWIRFRVKTWKICMKLCKAFDFPMYVILPIWKLILAKKGLFYHQILCCYMLMFLGVLLVIPFEDLPRNCSKYWTIFNLLLLGNAQLGTGNYLQRPRDSA